VRVVTDGEKLRVLREHNAKSIEQDVDTLFRSHPADRSCLGFDWTPGGLAKSAMSAPLKIWAHRCANEESAGARLQR
jgi:hypothetical protein